MPVQIDLQFTVARSNAAGLTGLIGQGVRAVSMHTSTTASATNLNPADGYIVVQLSDAYSQLLGCRFQLWSPNSGSSLLVASAGLTVGQVYVITILGTTTNAAWLALGVPAGVTPAVGVAFVALATSALGTGAVQVQATAGSAIEHIEIVGNPNVEIAPANPSVNGGAYVAFACFDDNVVTQPADGTTISLSLLMSNSSLQVNGMS